jgi:hypothetical protein
MHNKRRNSWELEDAVSSPNPENTGGRGNIEATTYISSVGEHLLKDTVIYCAAEKYGLEELKRLALRKQGLQSGIEVATILRSARYAYDNTPDTDSRLRAHYLALIIRCRKTFKRSGTMQTEMESGGKLFFDLFVALCNHVDDIVEMGYVFLLFPLFSRSQGFNAYANIFAGIGTPNLPRPSNQHDCITCIRYPARSFHCCSRISCLSLSIRLKPYGEIYLPSPEVGRLLMNTARFTSPPLFLIPPALSLCRYGRKGAFAFCCLSSFLSPSLPRRS